LPLFVAHNDCEGLGVGCELGDLLPRNLRECVHRFVPYLVRICALMPLRVAKERPAVMDVEEVPGHYATP
jgi:hypothetical protein